MTTVNATMIRRTQPSRSEGFMDRITTALLEEFSASFEIGHLSRV